MRSAPVEAAGSEQPKQWLGTTWPDLLTWERGTVLSRQARPEAAQRPRSRATRGPL